MLGGLGGDVDEDKVPEEKTVPEGVPDRSKQNSLRKRKPNFKHDEDYLVDDDVLKAIRDTGRVTEEASNVAEQILRTSSRKRKPNPKHCKDEGSAQSGLIEDNVVGLPVLKKVNGSEEIVDHSHITEEKTQVSLPKQKAKCKDGGDGGKAQMEEDVIYDGATESASQVPDETKRISSRKRKPNFKYSEEKDKAHTWLSKEDIVDTQITKDSEKVSKNVSKVTERETLVSKRKRKQNRNNSVDNYKPYLGLNVIDATVAEEIKDLEGANEIEGNAPPRNKKDSLRKRNPNTKYNENVEDDDVDAHFSEEGEDTEGADHDAIWVSEKNVRVSSRKRKPNTKYSEDGDYSFSAPVVKVSPMIGENGSKGSSKRCFELSHGRKLTPVVYPPPHRMLSLLRNAASDPMTEYSLLIPLISFLVDYRNSLSQGPKRSIGTKISGVKGAKVSYQVNIISESNIESETIERETNGAGYKDGKTKEEYTPTAVILFFVDIDSIPSKSDLHHVFDAYGPLIKAHTEVVKRLRRARVVFKRRSDAENAHKSSGRFSIFGPSLVSYRLSYFYPE